VTEKSFSPAIRSINAPSTVTSSSSPFWPRISTTEPVTSERPAKTSGRIGAGPSGSGAR
jgi:hypothetical protein